MKMIIKYTGGGPKDGHVETMTEDDSFRLGVSPGTPPTSTNFPSKASGYDVYDQCSVETDPIDGTMHVMMRYVGRTCYSITVNVSVIRDSDSGERSCVPAQITVHRDSHLSESADRDNDPMEYYLDHLRLPDGNIATFSDIDSYLERGKVVRLSDDDGCVWYVELPDEFTEIAEARSGDVPQAYCEDNGQTDDEC